MTGACCSAGRLHVDELWGFKAMWVFDLAAEAVPPERRYSPAKCIGTIPTVITGRPRSPA
jgi:hypothetical protein